MVSPEDLRKLIDNAIENNTDLNKLDSEGNAFIHYAAEQNLLIIVAGLLQYGATVDQANKNGWTALILAAHKGHLSVVEKLLEAGAKVDQAFQNGWTVLMYAAANGHLSLIEKLLEAGATVDQADGNGSTALMYAARHGHKKIIEALVTANADYNVKCNDGKTAMDYAESEEVSQHLQKCINDHQFSALEKLPEYGDLFKNIPVCPISYMPITHLLGAKPNGRICHFEKGAITQWLSSNNTCPITRKPLSLADCFKSDHEQERITKLWNQVGIKYTEYKQRQSSLAQVSMFEGGAAAAGPASISGKRDCEDGSGGAGPARQRVRRQT